MIVILPCFLANFSFLLFQGYLLHFSYNQATDYIFRMNRHFIINIVSYFNLNCYIMGKRLWYIFKLRIFSNIVATVF